MDSQITESEILRKSLEREREMTSEMEIHQAKESLMHQVSAPDHLSTC